MSSSRHRVPAHTPAEVNRRIQQEIKANVHFYEQNPTLIRWRLQELDREWDIERAIQANAGALCFLGSLLSTRNRRWLLLPLLVTGVVLVPDARSDFVATILIITCCVYIDTDTVTRRSRAKPNSAR